MADAALEVLAHEGARGLTHRGVDRALGLSEGSTSAYYRTRAELVAAAATRLCELDLEDVRWQARLANARTQRVDAEYFAGQLAATFATWLTGKKRARTLARCELFLEATRDAQVRRIMARTQRGFLRLTRSIFGQVGIKEPGRAAEVFVDFALGLLYGRATSLMRPVGPQALKNLLLGAIRSLE
jgi:DNA-binding transcriptional regulator YbjK